MFPNDADFKEKLRLAALKLGLVLTDFQLEQCFVFYQSVLDYNKSVNLTAITDENGFIVKHFLDSFSAAVFFSENSTVVDVGAGAGFPSLPLKILRPDLNFTLVDSLNKRVVFLETVINRLRLKNTSAIHARAEDFARQNLERFDFACARAVASLPVLCEYILPMLKIGGRFVAYKSVAEKGEDCLPALKKLKGEIIKNTAFELPFSNDARRLIVIEKTASSPLIYPRATAKIKKLPL